MARNGVGADTNIRVPVRSLSGGQRQVVAISGALYFNAKALIMDEPCAALGPEETRMVHDLARKLKAQGVGIFLISHDMPDPVLSKKPPRPAIARCPCSF